MRKLANIGVLGSLALMVLVGCGKGNSTKTTTASNLNNTPLVQPPIPGAGCTASFSGNLRLMTDPNTIKVGSAVTWRIEASLCQNSSFHVQGRPESERFASFLEITKTYGNAGISEEVFIVEAFAPGSNDIVAMGAVRNSVNILPQPTSTVLPPPLSCSITRVAGKAISTINEPLAVIVNVTSALPASVTLNGLSVPANMPVFIQPNGPATGRYTAVAEVRAGGAVNSCSNLFETPLCSHKVNQAVTSGVPAIIALATETILSGPIARVEVNGMQVPMNQLPIPPNNKLLWGNQVPYAEGLLSSSARVTSPLGDAIPCTANYTATIGLGQVFSSIFPYVYGFGFHPGTRLDTVVVGLGAAPDGTSAWTYRNTTFVTDILQEEMSYLPRVILCGEDEVMVGRQIWWDKPSALSMILCGKLREELGVKNISHHPIPWNFNTYGQCPVPKVLVGNIYAPGGLGPLGTLDLVCGEIYQK